LQNAPGFLVPVVAGFDGEHSTDLDGGLQRQYRVVVRPRESWLMPNIAHNVLTEFTIDLLLAAGVPRSESEVVAQGLVGANLRGHDSHGVLRLPQYLGFLERGEYRTGVDLFVEHETAAVVATDAQWGFGQVQAHRLLDRLLPKVKALGFSAGTARRCGHIGRLGEYADRAAAEGLVLIATVNNDGTAQRVAPPGGIAPRLGTNPLCVGVPTDSVPIILDFGTSVVAEGKVRAYYLDGKRPVPVGWLFDHRGKPTTDPSVLYEPPLGGILPMGGAQSYKGFGLSLVLDMLGAGLAGGRTSYPDAGPARGNNVLFVVIDPDQFAGRSWFVEQVSQLAAYVRSCPRAEGVESIVLPGDPERAAMEQRSRDGIPLSDAHWTMLTTLAARFGVTPRQAIWPSP
jgi:uncharacterized oxidoreductase